MEPVCKQRILIYFVGTWFAEMDVKAVGWDLNHLG